jgi:hypothetical protein
MIIINLPNSFTKNADHIIKISREAVRLIPKVSSHPYYQNATRWSRIVFNFMGKPANNIEVVVFNAGLSEPAGIFSVSDKATESFELGSIVIHDHDGGTLMVNKEEFPNDSSLIFEVNFSE